ncbi:hypothetical protein GC169_04330 [bacterium]|nr:hypothetical protein [bacterium]
MPTKQTETRNDRSSTGTSGAQQLYRMNGFDWTSPADIQRSALVTQRAIGEIWAFWAKRLRAYADYADAIAGAHGIADLAEAQSEFVSRTQAEWAEESQHIAEIAREAPGRAANAVN